MISHLPSKFRLPGIREVLKRHGGCSGCGNGVTLSCVRCQRLLCRETVTAVLGGLTQ